MTITLKQIALPEFGLLGPKPELAATTYAATRPSTDASASALGSSLATT